MKKPIAIAANDSLISRYLLQQLQKNLPDEYVLDMVIHETSPYPWKSKFHQFNKKAFPNIIRGLITNPYWRLPFLEKRAYRIEKQMLFSQASPTLPEDVEVISCDRIHDQKIIEKLKKHNIKMLFIMGTMPVKQRLLDNVPQCYGLFFGAIPNYAGLHAQIWAAANGDASAMVVTLHRLNRQIGMGQVIATQAIERDPRLSLLSMRALSVLRASNLLLDFLHHRLESHEDSLIEASTTVKTRQMRPPASIWVRWKASRQLRLWADLMKER